MVIYSCLKHFCVINYKRMLKNRNNKHTYPKPLTQTIRCHFEIPTYCQYKRLEIFIECMSEIWMLQLYLCSSNMLLRQVCYCAIDFSLRLLITRFGAQSPFIRGHCTSY